MKGRPLQVRIMADDGTSTIYEFKSYQRRNTFIKRHLHLNPIKIRCNAKALPNHDLFTDFVPCGKNINQALNRGEAI